MDMQRNSKRLNKFLADSGFCSRREADRLIEAGQVTIDGRVGQLGDQVTQGMDVRVRGRKLTGESEKIYIALNKPEGIVCTTDPREPMNVVEYLRFPARLFPVGRLDKDSSGLLLMTSDGEIVNRLLRAEGGHEKEYLVVVDQALTDAFVSAMESGVEILGRRTLPCKITRQTVNSFTIVLVQGMNRQIRRMCDALGFRVRSLKRVRVMNIELGDMQPGHWRHLTQEELDTLFGALKDSSVTS